MKRVFVDTSYLLALSLADDADHERAVAWNRAIGGPLVTTEYVLVEYADGLAKAQLRAKAHRTLAALQANPLVTVVPASTQLLERGLRLYIERLDKDWELTDCISFQVMTEYGITDALTSDRHYQQAGFRALLRLPVEEA
jgi:predicted nucleic acid-binding protein